ncbi:MarR family winged helix-turn-helix transcriptional regulator [Miniphocaeibacter halophilus]|uniref:MarR family transcriptional regulator n=1 Tax=Miniphocaeibacter halophilus TaxID=2931922 RepID=A0AC61MNF1_9FIRM|nr:helix-turn-helix domain-containing protein [Miniphocaeibacter halophilus]QQK07092.1 MarR family transcriptional regulator [Miniphocaeibacter halophilus]
MKRELVIQLKTINFFLNKRIEELHKSFDGNLSPISGLILKFIFQNSDKVIFQKDIEEEFSMKKSRLSKILSSMEKEGYVKRVSVKEDARLKQIILGEKAKELNENILKSKEEIEKIIFKNIDEKNLDIFFEVLQEMVSNLKKDME